MLKLIFLGSSDFAVPILERLCVTPGFHVLAAVTRPDSRAGRGRKPCCTPVSESAERFGVPLCKPEKLVPGLPVFDGVDMMVSAAFGAWLPGWLLKSVPLGVVNVHPSLLPDFRGAAPVIRTILSGAPETGVSFMLTDAGWDTGPVIHTLRTAVQADETAGDLSKRLSLLAAGAAPGILNDYAAGTLIPNPQADGGSYADKICRSDAHLEWNRPAVELARVVRAFNPVPGAWTDFDGRVLKVHRAGVVEGSGVPGTFIRGGNTSLRVATGTGLLELLEVQPEGGRRMNAAAFLCGLRTSQGCV